MNCRVPFIGSRERPESTMLTLRMLFREHGFGAQRPVPS
jgi:hypothetical protein